VKARRATGRAAQSQREFVGVGGVESKGSVNLGASHGGMYAVQAGVRRFAAHTRSVSNQAERYGAATRAAATVGSGAAATPSRHFAT